MRVEGVSGLREQIGRDAAVSDWVDVTQERIDRFADATGDHEWIHVDPERASRESPFGGTIAHGFLTLSMLADLAKRAIAVDGVRLVINYGFDRVRFVAPVPAGSRVRGRFALAAVEEVDGGVQTTWSVTVEVEGATKPCCVAEWLVRYYI